MFRNVFYRFVVLCLVMGALSLVGCDLDDGHPFVDDHNLNSGLIGTWTLSGDGWSDTYTITAGTPPTITHATGFGDYTDYTAATIEYVYNFSETAGCLIIQRHETGDTKYSAVYFKNLTAKTVLLGDATDISIPYDEDFPNAGDPAVANLETAKDRFKPANAELYRGGSAQVGTPQTRQ